MQRGQTFDNRITRLLGVDIPIANAPMGIVANVDLVTAMVETGAIGLVPGSLGTVKTRKDIRAVRERTERPFGVSIPISFVQDLTIVEMLIEERVDFVTTSAGSAHRFTPIFKEAGLTVLHVALSLEDARQAVDAGVDGLVVEGSEGAGLRGHQEISSMVLLPLITSHLDVPVVAAGGIADGVSMAAAFALGAEGVQMGTRMLASAESAVHHNLKQAILDASETDTLILSRHNGRSFRVLRTKTTEALEQVTTGDPVAELLATIRPQLYEKGELEGSLGCVGQVSGRIDEVLTVAEIIGRTITEFTEVIRRLADEYASDLRVSTTTPSSTAE
jgi:enoyl-[acyl-carrier protein] reductase II